MSDSQDPNIDISGTISGNNVNVGGVQNNYFNTTGKPVCPNAPEPPEHFTGRAVEIEQLLKQLNADQVVAITAVQGMGGIGKTSLAKALCAQKRERFGAILWADITPSPNIRNELLKWFSYTGQEPTFPPDATPEQIADHVRGQLTAIFEMMCVGRVLVVLDDVWLESIHAAKLLRRAAPTGAKVLITTRNEQVIHELDGGEAIALNELPEADAKALLTSLTASHPLIRPEDRDRLYRLIGGHPLALEIAAATLKTAKDRPHLGRILDSYQSGLKDGAALKLYDRDAPRNLTVVFDYSYRHLSESEQRAFRRLGIVAPDSVWDRGLIAQLWELNEDRVIDDQITALCDPALIHRDK
nr:NB-ARC domain-containing protein [Anaerolineae bacterium]